VKNQRLLAFMIGTAVLLYITVFILLFIWFPWSMTAITVSAIVVFLILTKKDPYDHELWPDLYQK